MKGGGKMVKPQNIDTELLNKFIDESGLKIAFICEKLGISQTAFNKKRTGKTPFRGSEIYVLQDLCGINNDDSVKIFYPKSTQK